MRSRYFVAIIVLLAATVVIPRLCAGTLLVRYDILFWDSYGNGYAPAPIALGAKLLSLGVAVVALIAVLRKGSRKLQWLFVMVVFAMAFLSITQPPESDTDRVIGNGQVLVQQIEAYHKAHGKYPDRLSEIPKAAKSGLAGDRLFYYVCAESRQDDKGPWFPSTRAYLGNASYVICAPMVPEGTLVYRPIVGYSDLPGYPERYGWYHTTRD
jgi:hypothetical protein